MLILKASPQRALQAALSPVRGFGTGFAPLASGVFAEQKRVRPRDQRERGGMQRSYQETFKTVRNGKHCEKEKRERRQARQRCETEIRSGVRFSRTDFFIVKEKSRRPGCGTQFISGIWRYMVR
jgi:hypothetical protein